MKCAVGPAGQIAVLAIGRTTPELYTLAPDTGRWNEIDLPDADRLALTHVQWLPDLGWLLTGSRGGETDQEAAAYLGTDLASWTEIGVASDGDTTSVSEAAISGGELYLLGAEDGQPALWARPVGDLPAGAS